MSRLYLFLLNQWKLGKDEIYVNNALEKGYITAEEKELILTVPQIT
jgi:hypothetical protein